MSNLVIKVEKLGKKYIIGHQGNQGYKTFREQMVHGIRNVFSKTKQMFSGRQIVEGDKIEEFWALSDVSFEVKQGETIGIIGRNGAGKSTLLKILSRITEPTTGTVGITGRVASLLEVGTGFHPELTGRENIFLNGAILGMSQAEIKKKFDEIVDFSGVEQFLDTPVKRFSSGMYVRLAFSVAAHLEPEILIVDEVLAVGDAEFQKKCLGKMEDVTSREGRTILFVSHNMGAINSLCSKCIYLKKGQFNGIDKPIHIVRKYLDDTAAYNSTTIFNENSVKPVFFRKIFISDIEGNLRNEFYHDECIVINYEIGYNINPNKHDYSIFCTLLDSQKIRVTSIESDIITKPQIKLIIDKNFLVRGNYSIHTFIHKPRIEQIHSYEDICPFSVLDNASPFGIHGEYDYGKVFAKAEWVQQ